MRVFSFSAVYTLSRRIWTLRWFQRDFRTSKISCADFNQNCQCEIRSKAAQWERLIKAEKFVRSALENFLISNLFSTKSGYPSEAHHARFAMRSREHIRVKRILIRNFFYDFFFFCSLVSRCWVSSFNLARLYEKSWRHIMMTLKVFIFIVLCSTRLLPHRFHHFHNFKLFSFILLSFFPRHHPKPSSSQRENIADDDRDKNSLPHWWLLESIKKAKEGKFACRETANTGW